MLQIAAPVSNYITIHIGAYGLPICPHGMQDAHGQIYTSKLFTLIINLTIFPQKISNN